MGRRRMGGFSCPISIAVTCSLLLLLAVGSSRADNAEWQRMFPSSPYVGHETWHPASPLQHPASASPSATSKSNRVSFAAEDRAVPPPWLLPVRHQQQQQQQLQQQQHANIAAFPQAQLQVRSFFDDDSFEAQFNSQPWLDPQQLPVSVLPPPTAAKPLGKARPEQQQQQQQVPRVWPHERVIKEKKKAVQQQQQQPTASSLPSAQVDFDAIAPVSSSLASLADAADTSYDPYRVQSRSESGLPSVIKNKNNKPTAAQASYHDSSEYDDYGDAAADAAVFTSKRTSAEQQRPTLIKNKSQKSQTSSEKATTPLASSSTFLSQYEPSVTSQLEAGTEADGADYYDVPFNSNNQRHSSESAEFERVQSYDIDNPHPAALRSHLPPPNSRRQQQQKQQQKQRDEFQKRDHGFGTPFDERQRPPSDSFGWTQQQQQPYRPLTDELDVDFRPRDERPAFQSTSSRPSSAVHEGQHQPSRKQQQQQQQSGRDRPHTEAPNFDDEFRPIFSSEPHHRQQQQQPATSSEWPSRPINSNTDRPIGRQPVRHQSSVEDFNSPRPGPKRNNKPRPPQYPEEEQQRDLPPHPDFRPNQNNQQHHQPSDFDSSQDAGFHHQHQDDPQRPPAGRRPQQPNNDDFRQQPPVDQQQPTSFETPIDDQQQQQQQQPEHGGVEDHRPHPPGRRPPFRQQPPFNSGDQFSNDNNNPGPIDEGELNFNNGPPPPRPFNGPRRPPPQRPPQNSVVTQGLNSLRNLAGSLGLQSLAGNQQQRRPQRPNGQFRPESRRPGGSGARRPPIELSVDIGRLDKTAELEELALLGLADVPFDGEEGDEETMDASTHINSNSETLVGRSSSSFVKQQAIQDPVEHRVILSQDEEVIDPQDYDIYPPQYVVTSTTAAPYVEPVPAVAEVVTTTTTTTTSTSAPTEKASTLFPPFSKRVRPQLPTPAETQKPNKESTAGQLRITSYKQRLEAMKERAKQREQQLQPNNKEATDLDQPTASIDSDSEQHLASMSTLSSTTIAVTTSTTTRRPSTTRAKVPPRMPVRKPVTASSSSSTTTEKTPKFDSAEDSNPSKRRFKQKSTFARSQTSLDEESGTPIAAHLSDDNKDTLEEEETAAIINKSNRNTFAKIPTSPFDLRRAQLQKEAASEEAATKTTPSDVVFKKPVSKRRPNQSRTTAQPDLSNDDHASNLPTPKVQSTPSPQQATNDKEEEEEEPRIELIGISNEDDHLHHQSSTAFKDEPHHDEFIPHEQPAAPTVITNDNDEGSESHHQSADEEHKVEPAQEPSYLDSLLGRTRHQFSTMNTDDPILPIEELLNIRVRDNGKGMKRK